MTSPVNEELLEDLYAWVDQIPLSRPKKDIRRDFSDGVLVAELVKYYMPRLVDIHNYAAANNPKNKAVNWKLLNRHMGSQRVENVLLAETVKFFAPTLVDLHNFVPSANTRQKRINWALLNRKVFSKLNLELSDDVVDSIVTCKPWSIEHFLMLLRRKIDRHLFEVHRIEAQNQEIARESAMNEQPEVDQIYKATSPPSDQAARHNRPLQHKKRSNPSHPAQLPQQMAVAAHVPVPMDPTHCKKSDLVPRVLVEEKEQEVLAKVETIQILNAKVRRLEHLLHLKDIRIDDLQQRLDKVDVQMRPTAHGHKPGPLKPLTKH